MIPPLAISIFYHKISRLCGCQRRAYRGSGSLDQCLYTGRWRLVTQHYGRQSPSSWRPRSRRHAVGCTGRRHPYLRWSWGRNSQPGLRPADPARKPSSLKGRRSERFEPPKPPPQWPRLQARGASHHRGRHGGIWSPPAATSFIQNISKARDGNIPPTTASNWRTRSAQRRFTVWQ